MRKSRLIDNKSTYIGLKLVPFYRFISRLLLIFLVVLILVFFVSSDSSGLFVDKNKITSSRIKRSNVYCFRLVSCDFSEQISDDHTISSHKSRKFLGNDLSIIAFSDYVVVESNDGDISRVKESRDNNSADFSIDVMESYIYDVCDKYHNVDPILVKAVIWRESRFNPSAKNKNGTCVGLMQLSVKWNKGRANELGVYDLMDPYGNILVGVDLLSRLIEKYNDISLALMCYHGGERYGKNKYNSGVIDSYTTDILEYAELLREGD